MVDEDCNYLVQHSFGHSEGLGMGEHPVTDGWAPVAENLMYDEAKALYDKMSERRDWYGYRLARRCPACGEVKAVFP